MMAEKHSDRSCHLIGIDPELKKCGGIRGAKVGDVPIPEFFDKNGLYSPNYREI